MSEEWGPWIRTKSRKPSVGMIIQIRAVHSVNDAAAEFEGMVEGFVNGTLIMDSMPDDADDWTAYQWRIRKPKGMKILESLLENLPEEVDA